MESSCCDKICRQHRGRGVHGLPAAIQPRSQILLAISRRHKYNEHSEPPDSGPGCHEHCEVHGPGTAGLRGVLLSRLQ